jgi:VanZ family protein
MKYWLPVILWIGFIYLMSTATFSAQHTSMIIAPILRFLKPSISPEEINFIHFLIRKAAHITEYFISGILLFRAYKGDSNDRHVWRWAFAALVTIIMIALADEFHQSFVSVRTSSLTDVGIDTVGGMLGQVVSMLRRSRS